MSVDHRAAEDDSSPVTAFRDVRLGRLPLLDLLLAAGLVTATCFRAAQETPARPLWIPLTVAALIVAPVAVRQLAPLLSTLLGLAAATAYGLLGYGYPPDAGLGMAVGIFTVAMMCRRPQSLLAVGAALAMMISRDRLEPIAEALPRLGQGVLILIVVWALGDSTRRLSNRARPPAVQTAQAVAADRARIARDMHDVVAHHLSVISLQAGVAEYVVDTDPHSAKAAVATVAESSREALDDMRRLLDVLREEYDATSGSQPGLAGLPGLVERTRRTGLDVTLTMTGEPDTVPAGLGLCAYRVVQESLTNVLKHAGPAKARVLVVIDDRILTVTVEDDGGRLGPIPEPSNSYGIRGMRERAEMYDGVLTAAPSATGFTVRLALPLVAVKGSSR